MLTKPTVVFSRLNPNYPNQESPRTPKESIKKYSYDKIKLPSIPTTSNTPKAQFDHSTQNKPIRKQNNPPLKLNPFNKQPPLVKCFKCVQTRHKSNECLQRRVANLVDECDGSDEEIEYSDPDIEGVEAIFGDDEERTANCIVQKLLRAPKQLVAIQRHALFKTQCTTRQNGL